jgi:L,D-peptidoglycan transpeptidase YkuD (ErfK/YbiS/YcfS/YnhG family)
LDYRRVDRDDAWTYNPRVPRTYNIYQDVDRSWKSYGGYVEELWNMGMQYDYVTVLDYNLPRVPITTNARGVRVTDAPGDTRRGGGIFLHVDNGNKTAGCIAVKRSVMRSLMTWLDPEKSPVIVIEVD